VAGDYLGIAAALPKIASGIKVKRLIDRDDHAPADIAKFNVDGITVLSRRHLESYLYDDEVLTALCDSVGQSVLTSTLLAEKQAEMRASIGRGNSVDDLKSAAPGIYVIAKKLLGLSGVGNDQMSFARNTLAPLIRPGTVIYDMLKQDIFGL
jgi:hypothetical protein